MTHGAAHDPAQHIAPASFGGQHAVRDEEAGGAQMIGDDAVADLVVALRRDAARLHRRLDQRLEQVSVVIVVDALKHGGDALQPHAGVDGGARQLMRSLGEICSFA